MTRTYRFNASGELVEVGEMNSSFPLLYPPPSIPSEFWQYHTMFQPGGEWYDAVTGAKQ